jgi:hypothetical protein
MRSVATALASIQRRPHLQPGERLGRRIHLTGKCTEPLTTDIIEVAECAHPGACERRRSRLLSRAVHPVARSFVWRSRI